MSNVRYKLMGVESVEQEAPNGEPITDAEKVHLHTTDTLGGMVAFLRDDERFTEPIEFTAADEDKFVEHGSYVWYEGGVAGLGGTPYQLIREVSGE